MNALIAATEAKRLRENLSLEKTAAAIGLSRKGYQYLRTHPEARVRSSTCKQIASWLDMPMEQAMLLRLGEHPLAQPKHRPRPSGPLALCGCACGAPVQSVGARFIRGHYSRTADSKATYPGKVKLDCPECGNEFEVKRSHASKRSTCSTWCRYMRRLQPVTVQRLQNRVVGRMRRDRLTLRDISRATGVPEHVLQRWLASETVTLSILHLERLAPWLSLSPEDAIRDAGGITLEQRRVTEGRDHIDALSAKQRKLGVKRSVATRRAYGVKRKLSTVEKTQRTRMETGVHDRFMVAGAKAEPARQTNARLASYLRGHPAAALTEFRALSRSISDQLGRCIAEVQVSFNRVLRRRGLETFKGRHSEAERCNAVRPLLETWPRLPSGRRKTGVKANIAELVQMGKGPAYEWCKDHAALCPAFAKSFFSAAANGEGNTPSAA